LSQDSEKAAADLGDLRLADEVTSFSIFVRAEAHPEAVVSFRLKATSEEKTNVPTCFSSFAQTFKFLVIFLARRGEKGGRGGSKSFSSDALLMLVVHLSRKVPCKSFALLSLSRSPSS